ncbi:hypothetical protein GCM10009544_23290 [Streptomyces stramineus]|uniref:Uncharacterized protein n=1 Tax=Streptomyces stramineus TaxID=173861 RepID=A0ABP3JR24_9ACTN
MGAPPLARPDLGPSCARGSDRVHAPLRGRRHRQTGRFRHCHGEVPAPAGAPVGAARATGTDRIRAPPRAHTATRRRAERSRRCRSDATAPGKSADRHDGAPDRTGGATAP